MINTQNLDLHDINVKKLGFNIAIYIPNRTLIGPMESTHIITFTSEAIEELFKQYQKIKEEI